MVRRVYRAKDCVKYKKSLFSNIPVIKIKVYNVALEEYPEEIELSIDTGFEGSIMVTSELYRFFEIGELPREFWRTYRTLSGEIVMKVAKAILEIPNLIKLETYVETPLFGYGKLLMGRDVLNKLILILDGPANRFCVAE